MPIYAYKCGTCGHAKDVLQKISDAPLTVCPECGASTFGKQVTAAGFQLKGSGWYVTDFRNNGSGKGAAAGASSGGKDEGKTESKADSKPADSAATKSSDSASSSAAAAPATPAAPSAPAASS